MRNNEFADKKFVLHSDYLPMGDQPGAIDALTKGLENRERFQVLKGVTGSGKTFTMANIIANVNKPTLILAHNKTLAGQLYSEFKTFFPENAVEYFVSYYDYYQPEAYVPGQDLYIEKDSDINDDIDKLRHSATAALTERRDVIIVSSVSCIYGLGRPEDYEAMVLSLRVGATKSRDDIIHKLIDIQYTRNEMDFKRTTFRVRGDTIEIYPAGNDEKAVRVELFGDEIDRITEINPLTGQKISTRNQISIFPASHYVTSPENMQRALRGIKEELNEQYALFKEQGKLLEAQRIAQRTNFDIEMLSEMGYCKGIENYSRHINATAKGEAPYTLIDYFPKDFLLFVDESHVTLPQVRGMYGGDRSRKENLVEYGFRLPSSYDNRPLTFPEFEKKINQAIFVSATPGEYELGHATTKAEQIVRPTGLLDPAVEVVGTKNQIDHLIAQLKKEASLGGRVLITTLTKRMAEDLTAYIAKTGISVNYLHSDIDTVERMRIIKDLRFGVYDVIVGINLLREGLDIPEVTLIAILDADKEGFLRSTTSLIQTVGRAARNERGHVIMYADKITDSMRAAIDETNRRREKQSRYNEEHNITPKSIVKDISDNFETLFSGEDASEGEKESKKRSKNSDIVRDPQEIVANLEKEMKEAAKNLDFERAIALRDRIENIKRQLQ